MHAPEYLIADARRDATHVFKGPDFNCAACGRPRCFHVFDGFEPSRRPSIYANVSPWVRFKGPHPRWTRPGSFNKKELTLEQKQALADSKWRE